MTALCAGRDPDWWTTGDPGNRLAVMICRRCTSCPGDDPTPHGVIRQGVAYSDTGIALPACSNCGAPNAAYLGGPAEFSRCDTCATPNTWTPDARTLRRRHVVALTLRGLPTAVIAEEAGVAVGSVHRIRADAGIRLRKPRTTAVSTTREEAR